MKHAKNTPEAERGNVRTQEFLDMITSSVIKFKTDYFICGNTYRRVWVLREYPTSTEEQIVLKRLGERGRVTLKIYTRRAGAAGERKTINNTASEDRLNQSSTSGLQQTVQAESNFQGVAMIVARTHRNWEPLLRTAAYMELATNEYDHLELLQTEVMTELIRLKLNVDRLFLCQQQGFQCVMSSGRNTLWDQFEWVLPVNSMANLYPFNYSGKTDPHGFYAGRDKSGSDIPVDSNQKADDKTNGSILIPGDSDQGKSHLLKLIPCNLWEAGPNVTHLDPEIECEELTNNLDGCFINLMGGCFLINPLEPEVRDEGEGLEDPDAPETFRTRGRIGQRVSFLKDFFRSYKDFADRETDAVKITAQRLYAKCGLTDEINFQKLGSGDYPTLSELYELIEVEHEGVNSGERQLYTAELLQNIPLGLHSMCRGPEAKFSNGHTNVTDSSFVIFGVKGVLQVSRNLHDVLLFNTLSFMSNRLLTIGGMVVGLDESYLLLSSLTAVEYARNFMKRVREKSSSVIPTNQNLENFSVKGIQEYTKPLFSTPTHQLLFNAGIVSKKSYTDTLRLEASGPSLIRHPQRGVRFYKCGNERYNLMVMIPDYKAKLFGKTGGR